MKLHWKPSEFLSLTDREKALMIAFIDERLKAEEASRNKINTSKK